MSWLLDTCVISEPVSKRPSARVLRWMDAQSEETLYLSVLTLGEIRRGGRRDDVQGGDERRYQKRETDGMREDQPSFPFDQMPVQPLSGDLPAGGGGTQLHLAVVVGELDVPVHRQGVGHERVVRLVPADDGGT